MNALLRSFILFLAILTPAMSKEASGSWQLASSLPGLKPLPIERHAVLLERLMDQDVSYMLKETPQHWWLHEGDLEIDGSLELDTTLVVNGDLRVAGSLDDYSGDGHLIVLGDLAADNVFNWGTLHVTGNLDARGVIFAMYNDYTFGVEGKVNGIGLVVSDKSNDYTAGELGFEFNDMDEAIDLGVGAGKALRLLQPALFTSSEHLELDKYSTLEQLRPEFDLARAWVRDGKSLLRGQPASPELAEQAAAAIAASTPVETLRTLIKGDVLLAQLVAARPQVPETLYADLLAVKDETVQRWMAKVAPGASFTQQKGKLTPEIAATLATHPDTDETVLAEIANDPDPAVRVTLAGRDPLSLALREQLIADTEARVRAAFVNDQISAAARARLVKDPGLAVRRAVAALSLDAAQTRALLMDEDAELRVAVARSLRNQAEFRAARRMNDTERSAIALELLASADKVDSRLRGSLTTSAFLALGSSEQGAHFEASMPKVDPYDVMEFTSSIAVMERIVKMAADRDLPIPESLAENVRLPDSIQAIIIDAAEAWNPRTPGRDKYAPTPDDALEALLGNDAASQIVSDERFMQITRLILARGINRADGGMQNTYFHYKNFSVEAISAINVRLRHDESWALTVLLQRAATREQLVAALARWYDDKPDLQAELVHLDKLDDEDFWPALARADTAQLREAAARNRHTSVDLLPQLLNDQDKDVRLAACWNPQLPAEQTTRLARDYDMCVFENPSVPLDVLQDIAESAPMADVRRKTWDVLSLRMRTQI